MSTEESTSVDPSPTRTEAVPRQRRLVLTVAAGNLLEWYDFGIYGYFSLVISRQFFTGGGTTALLLTFATFGVGFLARPLGAVVFGHFGDRGGRRHALTIAVISMAASTFLIGCLPTYGQIGIAAPILLTVLRLVQGFSAGGEWAGSASYMIEFAPPERRGFAGSWQEFSVVLALILSSGVAALINGVLPASAVDAWGWRLPLLAGVLIAVPAIILRRTAPETPTFQNLKATREVATAPLRDAFRTARTPMAKAAGFAVIFTVAFYILLTYLSTWLVTSAGYSPTFALIVVTIENIVLALSIPFTGALSDRIGRKPLLLTSCALFALLSYPLFLLLQHGPAWGVILLGVISALVLGLFSGPAPAALSELFPARVRYTALSIPYQVVIAICGGFAPFIATLLVSWTHDAAAPSWYLVLAAVVSFVTILTFKETAKLPLK